MGSILSAIYDDEERYESLCKKFGEKEQELYSDHYNWIIKFNRGETNLSFEEYKRIVIDPNQVLKDLPIT